MLCMHIVEPCYKVRIFPFCVHCPLILFKQHLGTGLFDLPLSSRVCQLVKSLSLRFLMLDDVLNFKRCWAQEECNVGITNDNPYHSKSDEEIDSPISAKVSYLCDKHEKGRLSSD